MTAKREALVPSSHLGRAQTDQLRQILDVQRDGLLERLGRDGENGAQADASALDATLARSADQLEEVEAALVRIEEGTYGVCEACQDSIPFERLEAVPAAARCVRCQTRATSLLG